MSSTLSYYAPRTMLTLVALITAIVPFIADYNETHVFNPKWPGHARFHNGQTMSMGAYLGVCTLWKTWRSAENDNLFTATVLAAAYYITQFSAFYYPGATAWDPPQELPFEQMHLVVVLPMLTLVAAAYGLEHWRISAMQDGKAKAL